MRDEVAAGRWPMQVLIICPELTGRAGTFAAAILLPGSAVI